jgi:bifunctional DNA-binding transcriptional regulator/antitoxin component of YhaV-PrlF toxin-antitoxin module
MKTSFETILLGFGNNTGIQVPEANLRALGTSKKPPVTVTVNGFEYKSSVAVMGGKYMISFPKANREATGLKAGDAISVTLVLDEGIREVTVPSELQTALIKHQLAEKFNGLAYSKRKEFARQVVEAKAIDTRSRRIEKIISQLETV